MEANTNVTISNFDPYLQVSLDNLDNRVNLESVALTVNLDVMERPDPEDLLDHLDNVESLDLRENLDHQELLDLEDLEDLLDKLDSQVTKLL